MREDHLSSSSKSKEVRKICSSVFGEYGLDVVAKGESTLQYPFSFKSVMPCQESRSSAPRR